jgi:hypothetical protein
VALAAAIRREAEAEALARRTRDPASHRAWFNAAEAVEQACPPCHSGGATPATIEALGEATAAEKGARIAGFFAAADAAM